MTFEPTPHPILRLPTVEETEEMGPAAWIETITKREKLIAREKEDPLAHGWEPSIWRICDYLLGFPWVDQEKAAAVRQALGFNRALDVLLINGGNRSGKSFYAAKRVMQMLQYINEARAWCFHESNQNSVEYQHPLMWNFLPPDQRKKTRTTTAYISYNQKYGFSDNKFVLHNGSECSFRNYEQDREKIEGGELNIAWCDELVPAEHVSTLELRLTTRAPNAKMLITFTPVRGYNDTCKMFLDGAEAARESIAFLCPKDGGEELPEEALNLEDCMKWIQGEESQATIPKGRRFETVPRVMRCAGGDSRRGVVFFISSDNPYGNPAAVLDVVDGKPRWFVKERFYGVANKTMATRFPKFDPKVHVVPDESIPDKGPCVLVCDPSSGRNFYMLWLRVVGENIYAYREWPGDYDIPEVGVPGPWTLPDGKKADGRPGPAQDSFGYGLWKYKREVARLEGWEAWKKWQERPDADIRESEAVAEWSESQGADEDIVERYMDARAASSPRIENDRPVTLLTEFEDIGLSFSCAPGGDIAEGVAKINDLLDWDETQEKSFFNQPRLYLAKGCRNLAYSLANWTGKDGNKGASKDPIDALRYGLMAGIEDLEVGSWETEGGGHF